MVTVNFNDGKEESDGAAMELAWDGNFVRTPQGIAMTAQTMLSVLGGLLNIFSVGMATGLLGLAFWSTAFISGVLLALHVSSLAQRIEDKMPAFPRIELGYVAIWTVIFLVCCILGCFSFSLGVIPAWMVMLALAADVYFKFTACRRRFQTTEGSPETGSEQ